ncbi:MAG: serine hydrolase [Candidatus Marinimicrobia bacterium]|nr:serine hydrolase [Candidatus Neomarinimicrobiota bacterium]
MSVFNTTNRRILLLLSILFIGCQDLTTTDREFDDPPVPTLTGDGLSVSSLAEQGIDPAEIARLTWEIRNGDFDEIHSLVIIRNGYLVFEEYFEEGHDINYLHRLASVTKSVISLIVGTAVQEGFITSHNQPLYELFPDEADIFEDQPKKRKILLRHALTMTDGLRWKEGIGGDSGSDAYTMDHSSNSMRFILSRPIKNKPGEKFFYSSMPTLAAGAVRNASGFNFEIYADTYLFEKLGIQNYSWEHQSDGFIRADGGLHQTNRDMAKIGLLCLNNGVWNGEQILPENWMELSTKKWIDTKQGHHYGFYWWLIPHAGIPGFLIDGDGNYFGSGYGGQKLFIIPEYNLVIASFGSDNEIDTHEDHSVPHFALYNIIRAIRD